MATKAVYVEELRCRMSEYLKTEEELISTNDQLHYAGLDGDSDSYIWLRRPLSDVHLETVAGEYLANPESCPTDFLASVLREGLKTIIPTEIHLDGLSIDQTESSFRFCISGSTSLRELRNLSEQLSIRGDHAGEM